MRVVAETISTLADLERVRAGWRSLWRRIPAQTVFQSPDWLIAWWRHFAPGQLSSLALWRGEKMVAFAPLYREEGSARLLPLGISLSDCLDVLIEEDSFGSLRRAMEAEIARMTDCADICFPDVAPNASVLSLSLPGFAAARNAGQTSPELILGPADTPLKNVLAHQRQNLRTAENRARRRGCMTREIGAEELPQLLPALMQLHSARQRQLGRDGLSRDGRVLAFFIEAFAALAHEGIVRAYVMTCEARPIAFYLGFLHRGRASYYCGGFDPEFAFESPGTVLIGHAMRCAAAEGARIFDFLRGGEPYKYAWGARDRPLLSLSFARERSHVELAS